MKMRETLNEFYQNLNQEIINKAAVEDEENFLENIFTERYIDTLCCAGEIESGDIAYYQRPRIKINGFSLPEPDEEGITDIDIFVSIFNNNTDVYSVSVNDAKKMIERAENFFFKAEEGLYSNIDNNGDEGKVYDIAKFIYDIENQKTFVRIILLTNGLIKETILERKEEGNVTFIPIIWDLDRIYRLETSGNAREKISISFKDFGSQNLHCVKIDVPEFYRKYTKGENKGEDYKTGGYTTYLTMIPGELLYGIYKKYNSRLLEKNVRAFLQVKGKVNQGIRDTIRETPEMFLAYNNGISATAEKVITVNDNGNNCIMTGIDDFQIVNGGQTTASIFNTCQKNNIPLKSIYVQAKITVIKDNVRLEEIVPYISKYANTQNKIQGADFSANDKYHQEIEKLSRSIWAPARTGGQKQSKWFYERTRGQYADVRSRETNVKHFDLVYPKSQYFDKLLLARFENLWDQLPYITSKGGQTSFAFFTIKMKKYRSQFIPDESYYKTLVAKAILYKSIRKIVRNQNLLGFWANVADYTFAYLSYKTAQRIDLAKIWQAQDISASLTEAIRKSCEPIYNHIVKSANGLNVTQWCKQEACWKSIIKNVDVDLNLDKNDLVDRRAGKTNTALPSNPSSGNEPDGPADPEIRVCMKISGQQWWDIAKWGKDTDALENWQRSIAGGIARRISNNAEPSIKQAIQGVIILKTAVRKGFINNTELEEELKDL